MIVSDGGQLESADSPPESIPAALAALTVGPEPEPVRLAVRCDVAGCKDRHYRTWPHGVYCLRHAKMMAPRVQWESLGIAKAIAAAGKGAAA